MTWMITADCTHYVCSLRAGERAVQGVRGDGLLRGGGGPRARQPPGYPLL